MQIRAEGDPEGRPAHRQYEGQRGERHGEGTEGCRRRGAPGDQENNQEVAGARGDLVENAQRTASPEPLGTRPAHRVRIGPPYTQLVQRWITRGRTGEATPRPRYLPALGGVVAVSLLLLVLRAGGILSSDLALAGLGLVNLGTGLSLFWSHGGSRITAAGVMGLAV